MVLKIKIAAAKRLEHYLHIEDTEDSRDIISLKLFQERQKDIELHIYFASII